MDVTRSRPKRKFLYVNNREEWRAWLEKHHGTDKEIWLVYHKKHTGKTRILYNDAVEEALCFGWIDSTVRTIDTDRFAQKFSVRNPKSPYSQANIERLKEMIKRGRVKKKVIENLGDILDVEFQVSTEILNAVKANKRAWKNFKTFSPSYVRIRIAFIEGARKRPLEFKRRLRHFIEMTEKNKQFGFGGIEKYY